MKGEKKETKKKKSKKLKKSPIKDFPTRTEEITLKRLFKREKKKKQRKQRKPSLFVKKSNDLFSDFAVNLFNENKIVNLEKNLIKANMHFTPTSYIATILMITLISVFVGFFLFVFLLFFDVSFTYPFITFTKASFLIEFLKIFWIVFLIPIFTFIIAYNYPSLEKKSTESRINQEMPFATIHMSAIAGSMIEPSKIFKILIQTNEYKYLEKEFIKIINGINVYGSNLVGALRKTSKNTASEKLSELLKSISTTITSGGNLLQFFDKRAKSLLFDYRLEREKESKNAETFMDIYISVVIAAPMIFMLLLIMMKISGFGIGLSNSAITMVIIMLVTGINFLFIIFLYFKNAGQ